MILLKKSAIRQVKGCGKGGFGANSEVLVVGLISASKSYVLMLHSFPT